MIDRNDIKCYNLSKNVELLNNGLIVIVCFILENDKGDIQG